MEIRRLETRHCDAGWRDYHFVKVTASDGVIGWSEYDEDFGSAGVTAVIERLASSLRGQDLGAHERVYSELFCKLRPAADGAAGQALGAIENALLDAKAKLLGLPCYALLGGKVRDRIRLYWSHCATWRISHPQFYPPAIRDLDGVASIGAEAKRRGFTALKTNIFEFGEAGARCWRPGFGTPFEPGRNMERSTLRHLRSHLEALRSGAGQAMDILLDLNFNCATEGYLKVLRELRDFGLFWAEIDSRNPRALRHIRQQSQCPISSCETLLGLRNFLPFFQQEAVDVAIIDAVWNGVWQSLKVAACAEAYEVNIAPHNFYGHLATMMNAHFVAAVPNLRIMEIDIDRLSWDDDLFTEAPVIEDGHLLLPDRPGWGTEPVEQALRDHPVCN
ncbi:MAG: mandelate racemase/muconate lactonizing enzyme family protein [Bryobacterales bacterium]|nr:mandelate racemase/muconate lactonizing enzyme family protein [Bryobacterales bacterium]